MTIELYVLCRSRTEKLTPHILRAGTVLQSSSGFQDAVSPWTSSGCRTSRCCLLLIYNNFGFPLVTITSRKLIILGGMILNVCFSSHFLVWYIEHCLLDIPEPYTISLINQHGFKWSLDVVVQQAITWTNIGQLMAFRNRTIRHMVLERNVYNRFLLNFSYMIEFALDAVI